MVQEIRIDYRRARIWTDEFPAAIISGGLPKEVTFPSIQGALHFSKVACELHFFTGRDQYALLGCSIAPCSEPHATVQLFETGHDGPVYGESLLLNCEPEKVRIGLPREYIAGVLGGLQAAQPLIASNIAFHCAAHAEIGSSQVAFAAVANILAELIQLPKAEWDEKYLTSLVGEVSFSRVSENIDQARRHS